MTDRTLEETFYIMFTTRNLSTNVPATLAGTPVVSAYEDNSLTQITAGITLGVDHDSVTGLNILTIAATAANGFEAGKTYNLVITTGTVGGSSVVGVVVGTFTIQASAAYTKSNEVKGIVENIATGSAAISVEAESYVLTTGTQSSGTVTDTHTRNASRHEHTDSAGGLDLYYQFNVGGNGTAVEVDIYGYLNSGNDDIAIYAYDWGNTAWDQIGTLEGKNGSSDEELKLSLLVRHTGSTGADSGKVRIRFYESSSLSSATLRIDQIVCEYAVISRSVGYAGGQVWIDTTASNTDTESYVDGVADHPVSTIAAANTIAGNVGLHQFYIEPGSSITFAATQDNEVFNGKQWTLALGSQDIGGSRIVGASNGVSGIATGLNPFFYECSMGACTLPPCAMQTCGLSGTITVGSVGDFFLVDCFSQIAGASSPIIDMGSGVGATNVSVRRWSGGLTFNNIASGDVISLDGIFGTITLNGADGQVEIRGIAKAVVDNRTGSPTLNNDAMRADDVPTLSQINSEVVDALATDTYAEPGQGAPGATVSLSDKIGYLYKAWRNKKDNDGSDTQLYADDGTTVDQKQTTSELTGTVTKGEWTSGP